MRTREEVTKAFNPIDGKFLTETQKIMIHKMTTEFCDLAEKIAMDVPECADRTAALRLLLEAKFTCVQAITHTGYTKESAPVTKTTEKKTNGKDTNATTVHAS